jgi:exopolysaccharide biosynthesis polyprenyl glycosylphosphotransferase
MRRPTRSDVVGADMLELERGRALAARRRILRVTAISLDAIAAGCVLLLVHSGVLAPAIAASLATVILAAAVGGYRFGNDMTADIPREAGRLVFVAMGAGWFAALAGAALGIRLSSMTSVTFVPVLAANLVGIRALLRMYRPPVERVVVIGSGSWARRIADLAERHLERHFKVIGCLDDHPDAHTDGDPVVVGGLSRLPGLLTRGEVDRIVVASGSTHDVEIVQVLRRCEPFGIPVDVLPHFFDLIGHQPRTYRIGGTPMLTLKGYEPSMAQRRTKRMFDVGVAGSMLLLTAIPCLVVAAIIKLGDGGPVFYRQRRIGEGERPFEVMKFRTMVVDADRIGDGRIAGLKDGSMSMADAVTALKQADDPRITRVGHFLRATSLDELPQIINVLRGQMSIVGPRPLRDFEVDSLAGWERDRQHVRPGLTGLWQVSGRSGVGWEERLSMDYLYVRHWSLAGDARILCATIPVLFGRRGAQ